MTFSDAITTKSLTAIRKIPKADLHNHCLLGGKRSVIESYYGKKLERFKAVEPGIGDLNNWIGKVFRPFFELEGAFEKSVEAAFIQAKTDGVTRLEMSIDVYYSTLFNKTPDRVVATLKKVHQSVAPGIDFRPELGLSRILPLSVLQPCFEAFLGYDYFRSIDLYDDENAQPIGNFKELYRHAKNHGMRCKAHAGEFGPADSVKEAVETLELDAVQHGIGAVDSTGVMRWLAGHHITLNICPTSNIRLKRVRSYKSHPIRILFDNGVKVTINTDDALIFGDGVSEQFLKLYKSGVFTANELEIILNNGL